jgi:hypothetical protein
MPRQQQQYYYVQNAIGHEFLADLLLPAHLVDLADAAGSYSHFLLRVADAATWEANCLEEQGDLEGALNRQRFARCLLALARDVDC